MVKAIEFAVRDSAGGVVRGSVAGDGGGSLVKLGVGEEISLNLARQSVISYVQQGDDLIITLVDGRQIVLDGYFNTSGEPNQLYLSQSGDVAGVDLSPMGDGTLAAAYGPSEGWDKFSTLDDLRFAGGDDLALLAPAEDEPAGMAAFLPGLVGLGGAGAAGLAGLGLVGAVVGGGGGGGSGGGQSAPHVPTVNDPDSTTTVTTETPDKTLDVSGTGEPGDSVTVTVGGETQQTTIRDDGTWSVTFPDTQLPADGTHEAEVVVDHAGGGSTTLDGPTFVLDLTPPDVSITQGAKSTGDVENAAEYQDGVTIAGRGEPGAAVRVEINGHTQATTIAANGSWSVTFPTSQIATGEYEVAMKVTATDALGNDTVLNDTLVVDTVPHPVSFAPVTADNTVSGAENAAGFAVTGTSTAGAVLTVTIQGVSRTVTVAGDGTWTASYAAGTLTPGQYNATVTATTTDAVGNPTTATHSFRVDTMTSVAFAPGAIAGDDVVNATEAAGGVTMTGTAEPGSAVSVAWNGQTRPATVAADGSWTATFPAAGIAGGTYATTATVTATDAFGNTATATRSLRVDTQTQVAFDAPQVGDNVVSSAERTAGIALTGQAEAGARVQVTFEGVTRTVTADATGHWTTAFGQSDFRTGTYDSTVSVVATDLAGNIATAQHTIRVDTEVVPFQRLTLSTGADGILNSVESAAGLTVTGRVEPGATVMVKLANGTEVAAVVAGDGTWTATIPTSQIPAGETQAPLTIVATDRYGNSSTLSETVSIDRIVRDFARTGGAIAGDGIVNATEAASGLTFSGTVEPFSSVVVRLSNGQTVSTAAGANGLWSATFAPGQLPAGDGTATATFTATDRAGNVATFSETFAYDTILPTSPVLTDILRDADGVSGVIARALDGEMSFHQVLASGVASDVGVTGTTPIGGAELVLFDAAGVADGSYLVIESVDDAGNASSTLAIVNNTTTVTVDLTRPGLGDFDFGAIDLTFAPEANLTITAADLAALTGPDQQLLVRGDADDTLRLDDATATGLTRAIDGQTFDVYTLGTGTVLVDEDIQTSVI